MKKKERTTLGALVMIYICAIGLIFMFGPSATFHFNKYESQGIVNDINLSTVSVKFTDFNNTEYVTIVKQRYKKEIAIGDKVKIFYRKNDPKDTRVPIFEGREPYLVSVFLIIMGIVVVIMAHRDYLEM